MHVLAENPSIDSGPVLIPARAFPRWEAKGWRLVADDTPEADATSDEDIPTIPVDPFDTPSQED
jgi:hypothetical protein